MKPVITWILIADGARARVVENAGVGKGLKEVDGLEFSDAHLRAGDIMADKPGRAFSSAGTGRSAMEPPTDPVDKREADFATGLAEMLKRKLHEGAYDRLIIAAAPQALGDIRKALSPQVQARILTELPKDFTRVPNAELERTLKDILAV